MAKESIESIDEKIERLEKRKLNYSNRKERSRMKQTLKNSRLRLLIRI